MKKFFSAAMAAVTAVTCGIGAYAEQDNSEALKAALTVAKSRVEIPEECTEFSYNLNNYNMRDIYELSWSTKEGSYKGYYITVDGNLITSYAAYSENMYENRGATLAKLSKNELYTAAVKALKMLNPSVYGQMRLDKSSLNVSLTGTTATYSIQRVRNGVPVKNDRGSITINKDTGELIRFSINWHPSAAFQSKKSVISVEDAQKAYTEMIGLTPQYEIYYDYENKRYDSRLVYVQSDYGQINAFTGKKSSFESDGYFGNDIWDSEDCVTEEADKGNPETGSNGGIDFTEQEMGEINKNLPYGNADGVKSLVSENKYLTWENDFELTWSLLYKQNINGEDIYFYNASFETNWEGSEIENPIDPLTGESCWDYEPPLSHASMDICVNAETGEIIRYNYSNSEDNDNNIADEATAEEFAKKAAKALSGKEFSEYTDYSKNDSYYHPNGNEKEPTVFYSGSYCWNRKVNDIRVSGDRISLSVNHALKVESYSKHYSNVEFASPEKMLTPEQVMSKVYETEKPELFYLAKLNKKKTKTVLVYGLNTDVYCDAFTGEFIYKYKTREENNLDGITNATLRKKAEILDMHGVHLAYGTFGENDAALAADLVEALYSLPSDSRSRSEEIEEGQTLTRGDAMKIFAKYFCGSKVAELKGIFKSPFADVADDDENAGYYAIAYAMGAYSGEKLEPASVFTYSDMINLIYNYLGNAE